MDIVAKIKKQPSWFSQPNPDHIAHLYQSEDELIASLTEFIRVGIKRGETCIIITTAEHAFQLEERLSSVNVNLAEARQSGYCKAYDASETMAMFMRNNLPDPKLFADVIGRLVRDALSKNKPVRAFGEMVALLWKDGNQDGVAQLEALWDDLVRNSAISLYCAYPRMYFDKTIHGEMLGEISRLHSSVTPVFA